MVAGLVTNILYVVLSTFFLLVIHMSRHFSSALTACRRCMVGYFGTLRAVNLNLWKLHLIIILSGVSGGSKEIATLECCIKSHDLTASLVDLLDCLIFFPKGPASRSLICFVIYTFTRFYASTFTPVGHNQFSADKHRIIYFE